MNYTFLGHQSWLITHKSTNILIDPILNESFGSTDKQDIEIFPPRKINIHKIPIIDAIFLSHEHFDHFHIPSLSLFPNTPIIYGPLMFQYVEDLIKSCGLLTQRTQFFEKISIKDLEITLFPPDENTVLWESRVSQLYITTKQKPQESVFIAVDALISTDFIETVNNENLKTPDIIIISNNSQITPQGVLETLDNCRDPGAYSKRGPLGIRLLEELVIDYLEELNCKIIIICGGGFTKKYESAFGSYLFSDQRELAKIASMLILDKKIIGPWPGETININDEITINSVDWVEIDHSKYSKLVKTKTNFHSTSKKNVIKPTLEFKIEITENIWKLFQKELIEFGRYFISSDLGDNAVKNFMHVNTTKENYIFLFIFKNDNQTNLYYALNINTSYFECITEEKAFGIPFGVECYFNDFIGMICGYLQIWDIVGVSMQAWYIGNDKLMSPICCLYNWYAEPSRPDLAYLNLKKLWSRFVKKNEECLI